MRNRLFANFESSADFRAASAKPFDSGASRRKFLKALAIAGAGAILPGKKILAQAISPSVRPMLGRVDVHHHLFLCFGSHLYVIKS